MDTLITAGIVLASAALGFFAGRVVVGQVPEMRLPGKVHGYFPTDDDLSYDGGDDASDSE